MIENDNIELYTSNIIFGQYWHNDKEYKFINMEYKPWYRMIIGNYIQVI